MLEEGLLGQGRGGEYAGKSEAGCPGHRIIVVKYSWAFGPDAISEQREQECVRASGRSLEQCCSPLAPTTATASPDRPRDAHHMHTPTLQLSSHTQNGALWHIRARQPPTGPTDGQMHSDMGVHPHLTQDPTPAISQAQIPSFSQQPRLTAVGHISQDRRDEQNHLSQPPPMS